MKPLRLEFSGLNSYRERQIVDFAALSVGGLFGIFGPTGSGKSSVLDALTLALYGKVERASGGTHGIINQRENTVEVSLTFELGQAQYRVARVYARDAKNTDGVRAKAALLTRGLDASAEVLADKPNDVDRAIVTLLGLKSDEFTRAVVLPQGKFDQFLRLQGKDRATMLEHLFRLERFGDQLAIRAKAVVERSDRAVSEALAEQAGLGDCSDGAIGQAREEAATSAALLAAAEQQAAVAADRLRALSELSALVGQLGAVAARQAELSNQSEDIAQAGQALMAARRAEPLRSMIGDRESLAAQDSECSAELAEAKGRLAAAAAAHDNAALAARTADERLRVEAPQLIERRTKLKAAVELQDRVAKVRADKAKAALDLGQSENRLAALTSDGAACERQLAELTTEMEFLRQKRAGATVVPEESQRLDAALAALQRLESDEDSLRKSAEALVGRMTQADQAKQAALTVYRQLYGLSLSQYTVTGGRLVKTGDVATADLAALGRGDELVERAAAELDAAGRLADQVVAERRQAELSQRAATLAAELHAGEPCPVCGSLHHPNPTPAAPDVDALVALDGEIKPRLDALRAWRDGLIRSVDRWHTATDAEQEARAEIAAGLAAVEDAYSHLLAAAKATVADCADVAAELAAGQTSWRGDGAAEPDATVVIARCTGKRPLAGPRSWLRRRKSELATLAQEAFDLGRRIDAQTLAEKQHQARLNGLLADQAREREARAASLKVLDGLNGQLSESEARLREIIGDADPRALSLEVERKIDRLQTDAASAQQAAQQAQTARQQAENEVAGLTARLAQISRQQADLERRLTAGLVSAGFAAASAAQAAMLPAERQGEIELRIQAYQRECAATDGERQRLEGLIAGRTFSADEHQALTANVQELTEEVKRLRGRVAVAGRQAEELALKRVRWDVLEQQRLAAQKRKDIAAELSRLLRGKQFVQFLAEEHLRDMAAEASQRLGGLTGQRYALELADGGDYMIRDDYNGSQRRAAETLSGGETFLTSLSLALALSAKIQLAGRYPLGFFFLDEGFGTLDTEKLELVIGALEKLHDCDRTVGVISHVKELRDRLPCYLEVVAARDDGSGSQVVLKRN